MIKRKYAGFDFEFNSNNWNEFLIDSCQIGIYFEENGEPIVFNETINCELNDWMINNTNLTQKLIDDSPTEKKIMKKTKQFIEKHNITHLVGYNPHYDDTILQRNGIIMPVDDIQQDCRRIQSKGTDVHCSLSSFYEYFYPISLQNHDALDDAKMTYNIFTKLN